MKGQPGRHGAGLRRSARWAENHFRFAYDAALPIRDKLLALTQRIYGGRNVAYTEEADREINRLTELGFGGLPVCVDKTQYSLSDDPKKLGPSGLHPDGAEGEGLRRSRVHRGPDGGTFSPCRVCPRPRRQRPSTWTKTASSPACSDR